MFLSDQKHASSNIVTAKLEQMPNTIRKEHIYIYTFSSALPTNLNLSSLINANDIVDYICAYTYTAGLEISH